VWTLRLHLEEKEGEPNTNDTTQNNWM